MEIAFTQILKTQNRQWEFNFRKLPAASISYHVDFTDEKGIRILFSMQKSMEGLWKINAGKLPLWIADVEEVIGETIEEQEKQIMNKKRA